MIEVFAADPCLSFRWKAAVCVVIHLGGEVPFAPAGKLKINNNIGKENLNTTYFNSGLQTVSCNWFLSVPVSARSYWLAIVHKY